MYPICHKSLNSALRPASVRVSGDSACVGTSDRFDGTPWGLLPIVDLHTNSPVVDMSAARDAPAVVSEVRSIRAI